MTTQRFEDHQGRWVPVRDIDADAVVTLARRLLLANADRPEQSTTGELARGTQHWVYERSGRPCRRCGERVLRAVQGADIYARTTYYCPRCQPGPIRGPIRRHDATRLLACGAVASPMRLT